MKSPEGKIASFVVKRNYARPWSNPKSSNTSKHNILPAIDLHIAVTRVKLYAKGATTADTKGQRGYTVRNGYSIATPLSSTYAAPPLRLFRRCS